MINNKDNPVEWALMLYELSDAGEHMENLLKQMKQDGKIDEENFKIQLDHIYSHLNNAWTSRNRL